MTGWLKFFKFHDEKSQTYAKIVNSIINLHISHHPDSTSIQIWPNLFNSLISFCSSILKHVPDIMQFHFWILHYTSAKIWTFPCITTMLSYLKNKLGKKKTLVSSNTHILIPSTKKSFLSLGLFDSDSKSDPKVVLLIYSSSFLPSFLFHATGRGF